MYHAPLQLDDNRRQAWIDGLRGLAACIVAIDHTLASGFTTPYRSFWAEPTEENRRMLQLPPFRLIAAGKAMVMLFFVISGYTAAIGSIRIRMATTTTQVQTMSSTIFTRGFRLYIPLAVHSIVAHTSWYIGLYDHDRLGKHCPDAIPWTHLASHIACWIQFMLDSMNCVEVRVRKGLNPQAWSMPYQFRDSLLVQIVMLALWNTSRSTRMTTAALLALYFFWYATADVFGSFAGVLVAEYFNGSQPDSISQIQQQAATSKSHSRRSANYRKIASITCLTIGIWLICLPEARNFLSLEYRFQYWLNLPNWDHMPARVACWHTVGALLILIALHYLPSLRRRLEISPLRLLGRISFSIYLVHYLILDTLQPRALDFVSNQAFRESYFQIQQNQERVYTYICIWCISVLFLGAITLTYAFYFNRLVEQKALKWIHRLGKPYVSGVRLPSSY